jgi:hypothetical protein
LAILARFKSPRAVERPAAALLSSLETAPNLPKTPPLNVGFASLEVLVNILPNEANAPPALGAIKPLLYPAPNRERFGSLKNALGFKVKFALLNLLKLDPTLVKSSVPDLIADLPTSC